VRSGKLLHNLPGSFGAAVIDENNLVLPIVFCADRMNALPEFRQALG
jgi:hypothetical protein